MLQCISYNNGTLWDNLVYLIFFITNSLVWIKIILDEYKSISWESISKVTLSYCPWNWLMYINKRSLKMSSHQKHRLLIDWLNNSALK